MMRFMLHQNIKYAPILVQESLRLWMAVQDARNFGCVVLVSPSCEAQVEAYNSIAAYLEEQKVPTVAIGPAPKAVDLLKEIALVCARKRGPKTVAAAEQRRVA